MALLQDVERYWNSRADGYSLRNCDELDGPSGEALEALFRRALWPIPGMRALDVGCGPGIFALTLAKLGCRVTGVDLSPEMLARARKNAADRGLVADFMLGDAVSPPFEKGTFDLIVSRYVVWNLPTPAEAYRQWMSLLKPGGKLLIVDGNHYLHRFDPRYAVHMQNSVPPEGHAEKYMQGVDPTPMEKIAMALPLSRIERPNWDIEKLTLLGANVSLVGAETHPVMVDGVYSTVTSEFCFVAEKPIEKAP